MPRRFIVSFAMTALVFSGAAAQAPPYLVVAPGQTRTLPVAQRSGSADFVSLDTLSRMFDMAMREDARTGGVVLAINTQRVVLTQGQATVSAGGRLQSLSAPVARDGPAWLVPIDFLRVLEPLLNRRIEIRRASRLIVLDSAAVPRITPRFERTATGGRLTLAIEPGTVARVSRDAGVVTVRFQADALDPAPIAGAPAEWVAGLRADGPSLLIELGASVSSVRESDTRESSNIVIELIGTPAPGAAPPRPTVPAPAPAVDRGGALRTIVIDPGHGGSEAGSRSAGGVEEKQVTLAAARTLKAVLESRLGVRVLLTRDADTDLPIDRRAAIANNNKADLFISLHANGAASAGLRGWQVQSLDATDYAGGPGALPAASSAQTVPIVGGGTRVIDTVLWHLAQLPHAERSASLAALLSARLTEAGLPAHPVPVLQAPLRVLVGANMPAVLIELGFLTNGDDAAQLSTADFQSAVAGVITSVIGELRSGWPAGGGGDR